MDQQIPNVKNVCFKNFTCHDMGIILNTKYTTQIYSKYNFTYVIYRDSYLERQFNFEQS